MIELVLKFVEINGDTWKKQVVIHRPMVGEFITDKGLLWYVERIGHETDDTAIEVTVRGEVKGNTHWELGHERQWKLQE